MHKHVDDSKKYISQNCLTYSKRYDQFVMPIHPTHIIDIDFDKGLILNNGDSNFYDIGGLGADIELITGNNFSLPFYLEVENASKLLKILDLEGEYKVKFLKTGTAALDAAVRFARAKYGNMVWFSGYHGCGDTFISQEFPGSGCVGKEHSKKFNTILELANAIITTEEKPCVVVVEPEYYNGDISNSIQVISDICKNNGICLVVDEVITGFRTPEYCVCNYLWIKPEIICFGKAFGNGYPVSAVVGLSDIMDNKDVFISNTHNGCYSTMEQLRKTLNDHEIFNINEFYLKCKRVLKDVRRIVARSIYADKIKIDGYPTRWVIKSDDIHFARLQKSMLTHNIVIGRSIFPRHEWFTCSCGNLNFGGFEVFVDFVKNCFTDIFIGKKLQELNADEIPPQPVFRRV